MAWKPLAERHGINLDGIGGDSSLPLVLLGPILRRVEKDSVTVFLVLRKAATVKLTVHNSAPYNANLIRLEGETTTSQLGRNLHVVALTATPVFSPDSDLSLVPDTVYLYDIEFVTNSGTSTLSSQGTISNDSNEQARRSVLAYDGYPLPSFLLPASNLNDLRVLHGSCRKPHGGGPEILGSDALAGIDKIIESAYNIPSQRPQQLFMTGDQIYADDVCSTLFHMIEDAAGPIMGNAWNENLEALGFDPEHLSISLRQKSMEDASFTAFRDYYGVNHLIKLEEYYLMYLFCWSDVLWPDDEADIPNSAYIDDLKLLTGKVYHRMGERKFLDYLYHERINHGHLRVFYKTLKKVRRALANIATYMMFDDHDVTDDWFLNYYWSEQAIANPRGKRIIQNGLSAFAIFQAWGNTPAYFEDFEGGWDLLEQLKTLYANNSSSGTDWTAVGNTIVPTLQNDLSSVGDLGSFPTNGKQLAGGPIWSFDIVFDSFRVVVLDTRTRRGFQPVIGNNIEDKMYAVHLLSSEAMHTHVKVNPGYNHDLTIVVSPAPVIGHKLIEGVGQPAKIRASNLKHKKDPSAERGEFEYDFETWSGSTIAFSTLLKELVPYGKVVILSGDVHYAFSAQMQIWDTTNTNNPNANAVIAQLTASSAKNQDKTTLLSGRRLQRIGEAVTATTPHIIEKVFAWEKPQGGWPDPAPELYRTRTLGYFFPGYHNEPAKGDLIVANRSTRVVNITPVGKSSIIEIFIEPSWEYSTEFMVDRRDPDDRGIDLNDPTPLLSEIEKEHSLRSQFKKGRAALGQNNIGEVTFNWNYPAANFQVIHNLWYSVEFRFKPDGDIDLDENLPYTQHIIDLSVNDNKPSEEPLE